MSETTRFAPSPSGHLHLGHAFSALFAQEQAGGGRFLLRIEDIDSGRCRPEYEAALLEDLAWLGLVWEEPPRRQSDHLADYAAALERLNAAGLIYPCFCTRREIAQEIARSASAPQGPDGPLYPGTCRELTAADASGLARATGRQPAWRFRVGNGAVEFVDQVVHAQNQELAREVGDFVVKRRDGLYAYQLAVVVDDALMGVTDVVRGADLLGSTPRQIALYETLELPAPRFWHVPVMNDEHGNR